MTDRSATRDGAGDRPYDRLYRVYETVDTARLREYQEFIDLFPPVDSRVGLEYWEVANTELQRRKATVYERFQDGTVLAEIAARATRSQAFTALDLLAKYGRPVNVLVLDVDETLRSAGQTDNEIPRETLHALTALHERGIPIVICTGQTLENVKGFAIQGLGSQLIHSGDVSIVYETGTGVFTPGQGEQTKQLLYRDLGAPIPAVFEELRTSVLGAAPEPIRQRCHLQGNEFNVTLKPNAPTGSTAATEVIDQALVYLLDRLAAVLAAGPCEDRDRSTLQRFTRGYYAGEDPEIGAVLAAADAMPAPTDTVPPDVTTILDRIDVAYYHADAAEVTSRELNKVVGVQQAFDVLDVADPFALVMGDSKSDLRVMEWVAEAGAGIAAAPDHASEEVLTHVRGHDELVFDRGHSADVLHTVEALDRLAVLTGDRDSPIEG